MNACMYNLCKQKFFFSFGSDCEFAQAHKEIKKNQFCLLVSIAPTYKALHIQYQATICVYCRMGAPYGYRNNRFCSWSECVSRSSFSFHSIPPYISTSKKIVIVQKEFDIVSRDSYLLSARALPTTFPETILKL